MLRVAPNLGIAVGADGVGTKVIVAEQTGRYDTVGIDCIAMNVNDVICVGAEPIAVLDYLAVEQADPEILRDIARGLKRGAEEPGVEIPAASWRSCPSWSAATRRRRLRPHRRVLRHGRARRDRDGRQDRARRRADRPAVGGVHSNGLTLARRALEERAAWSSRPARRARRRVRRRRLLEPT